MVLSYRNVWLWNTASELLVFFFFLSLKSVPSGVEAAFIATDTAKSMHSAFVRQISINIHSFTSLKPPTFSYYIELLNWYMGTCNSQ